VEVEWEVSAFTLAPWSALTGVSLTSENAF